MWLISGRDAFWTYLLGCGVDKLSLQSSSRKGPVSSADVHGSPSLRPVRRLVALELWPLTTGAQAPSPVFFRIWVS